MGVEQDLLGVQLPQPLTLQTVMAAGHIQYIHHTHTQNDELSLEITMSNRSADNFHWQPI